MNKITFWGCCFLILCNAWRGDWDIGCAWAVAAIGYAQLINIEMERK